MINIRFYLYFAILRTCLTIGMTFDSTFQCDRFPISFCCTTRMRKDCSEKCANIHCTNDFYKKIVAETYSNLLTATSAPRAKSMPRINKGHATFINGKNDGEAALAANGTDQIEVDEKVEVDFSYNGQVKRARKKLGNGKNRGIIDPSKLTGEGSLVEFANYDGEEASQGNEDFLIPPEQSITSEISSTNYRTGGHKPLLSIKLIPHEKPEQISESIEQEKDTDSSEISKTDRERVSQSNGFGLQYIKLIPLSQPEPKVTLPYSGPLDKSVNYFIGAVLPTYKKDKKEQLKTNETITPVINKVMKAECGVPPKFEPCVPVDVANSRLLECCRRKNLPIGCQNLCRYTIKHAMDTAQCGILHVTPVVECASGGHDNTACCRQRQIAQKSGPQCEIFCTSKLLGLGIQHLICSNSLEDMISCHHAGLTL